MSQSENGERAVSAKIAMTLDGRVLLTVDPLSMPHDPSTHFFDRARWRWSVQSRLRKGTGEVDTRVVESAGVMLGSTERGYTYEGRFPFGHVRYFDRETASLSVSFDTLPLMEGFERRSYTWSGGPWLMTPHRPDDQAGGGHRLTFAAPELGEAVAGSLKSGRRDARTVFRSAGPTQKPLANGVHDAGAIVVNEFAGVGPFTVGVRERARPPPESTEPPEAEHRDTPLEGRYETDAEPFAAGQRDVGGPSRFDDRQRSNAPATHNRVVNRPDTGGRSQQDPTRDLENRLAGARKTQQPLSGTLHARLRPGAVSLGGVE